MYIVIANALSQVQGMSFLAAVLLLNMEAADAFICLANLLNRPSYLAFFKVEQELVSPVVAPLILFTPLPPRWNLISMPSKLFSKKTFLVYLLTFKICPFHRNFILSSGNWTILQYNASICITNVLLLLGSSPCTQNLFLLMSLVVCGTCSAEMAMCFCLEQH